MINSTTKSKMPIRESHEVNRDELEEIDIEPACNKLSNSSKNQPNRTWFNFNFRSRQLSFTIFP